MKLVTNNYTTMTKSVKQQLAAYSAPIVEVSTMELNGAISIGSTSLPEVEETLEEW